jgi:predicted ribosomally synthesized peptide with SipW-like signal peptide
MNKKILGSVVAMVAVLALVGGGTFAAWTDQEEIEVDITSGSMNLELTTQTGGTVVPVELHDWYPGAGLEADFYVALAESVPTDLPMRVKLDVDNVVTNGAAGDALADEITGRVRNYLPTTSGFKCQGVIPGGSSGASWGISPISTLASQSPFLIRNPNLGVGQDAYGHTAPNSVWNDGDELCFRVDLNFPVGNATNASQSGELAFDLVFTLEQDL